jgi:uncharacterized protein (DUF58 family)
VRIFLVVVSILLAFVLLFFPFRILQLISLLYLFVLWGSYIYTVLCRRFLVVHRRDAVLRSHRFEPLEIVFTLENRAIFPIAYVTLIDAPGPLFCREPGKFVVGMRAREKKLFSYVVEGRSRGEYSIGPLVITGADPLGFFPWRLKLRETSRLVIYPEILKINRPAKRGLPAGNLRTVSRIYEDVTRYRSIREYVPGDDARRICWKASAKTGRLHSMEYLPALFSPVLVLMNLSAEDFPLRFRSHWIERSVITAASVIMHAVTLRQEAGLLAAAALKGSSAAPLARLSAAPGHATAILEMLACIEATQDPADFTRLLSMGGIDIPVGTRLEVITPGLTADQQALLRDGARRGWIVEVFLLGGELLKRDQTLPKEFPAYTITEYGSELIVQ